MTESVRRGPDTEEPKPQLLIKSTEPVLCGYAPRAILASQDKSRIFLGCKDGSVTVVGPVAETVVAPSAPWAIAHPRSPAAHFKISPAPPRRSISSGSKPTCTRPAITPMVAGIAPATRTASSSE